MSDAVRDGSRSGSGADRAVMIWRSGADMGCTYFSQSWLEFTGRGLREELGDGWATGVHPDDLARCLGIYQSAFVMRREFQMRYRLRHYDGQYRWILDIGTPEWGANGRFLGYVGSCVDVTEARRFGRDLSNEDPSAVELAPGHSVQPLTRRQR